MKKLKLGKVFTVMSGDALERDQGISTCLWWMFVTCAWAAFTSLSSKDSFGACPISRSAWSQWMVNKGVLARVRGRPVSFLKTKYLVE